jgi:hypothetical protein
MNSDENNKDSTPLFGKGMKLNMKSNSNSGSNNTRSLGSGNLGSNNSGSGGHGSNSSGGPNQDQVLNNMIIQQQMHH